MEPGLMRSAGLWQGWTNSPSVFQHIMGKVDYYHQIPHELRPFLDVVGIKGPNS